MNRCSKFSGPVYIIKALAAFGFALAIQRVATHARLQYLGSFWKDSARDD